MNWINSKKEMPKIDEEYITCGPGLGGKLIVSTLEWANGNWWSDSFNTIIPSNRITYWMPLPTPPVE